MGFAGYSLIEAMTETMMSEASRAILFVFMLGLVIGTGLAFAWLHLHGPLAIR